MAQADVELAEAALDSAKLDLEWTQVTSPIKGRVSRNKVDIGNLVGATEKTLLTTVVDDDPIYVYFNVSELDLLPLLRRIAKDPSSQPSAKIPVYLGLADETGYPHEGHFDFAETTVDSSTGTIQVRGIFPNADGLLLAGMFAHVRVPVETRQVLLIPDIAVQFDQGGKYVLAVDDNDVVQQKRIKTGEQVEEMRVIAEGLTTKDRVITTGVLRARPGAKVNATVAPAEPRKSEGTVPQPNPRKVSGGPQNVKPLFHRSAHFCLCGLLINNGRRGCGHNFAAHFTISADSSAYGPGNRLLSRSGPAGSGRYRGRPYRTAGQRR